MHCILCTHLKSPHTSYPKSQCADSEPLFYEISTAPDFYKQTRDETATLALFSVEPQCESAIYFVTFEVPFKVLSDAIQWYVMGSAVYDNIRYKCGERNFFSSPTWCKGCATPGSAAAIFFSPILKYFKTVHWVCSTIQFTLCSTPRYSKLFNATNLL